MSGYQDVPMTRRRAQLLEEYASKLADMLEAAPNDKDLAEWVQSKIDRAAAAIQSAYHYLDQDDESELEKARVLKYDYRRPSKTRFNKKTGKREWDYFYTKKHGARVTRGAFEAGAAFRMTWKGRKGHFHIHHVKGDQVFITHDSRPDMEPIPVQADELRALLERQHKREVDQHLKRKTREVEEIKRRAHRGGLGLALHRLRQAAAQAGVSLPEQYQHKPKKTRAKVAETAREVETPRDQLTSTAQQIIEDANQEHAERHDEHQEITRFELGEHTHTKTGAKLYTAKQTERVERDEYFRRLEIAKKHGGRYERRYVRGFVFKSAEDARAFALEVEGAAPPETSAETVTPHDEHPGADNFETMPEVESAPTQRLRGVLDALSESERLNTINPKNRKRPKEAKGADAKLIKLINELAEDQDPNERRFLKVMASMLQDVKRQYPRSAYERRESRKDRYATIREFIEKKLGVEPTATAPNLGEILSRPTTPSTRPSSAYYGRATKKLVDQALSSEPTGFDPKRSGIDLPTKGDLREMLSQEQRLKRAKEDLRQVGVKYRPSFPADPRSDIMSALSGYLNGPYVELEQERIREMERGLKIALRDSKDEELEQVKDETARFWREWGGEYKRLQSELVTERTEGEALRNIRPLIPDHVLTPEINQLLDQMERELDQKPVTGHDIARWIDTRDTNQATRDRQPKAQPTTPREQLTETAREVTQGADNFETMPEVEAPKSSARERKKARAAEFIKEDIEHKLYQNKALLNEEDQFDGLYHESNLASLKRSLEPERLAQANKRLWDYGLMLALDSAKSQNPLFKDYLNHVKRGEMSIGPQGGFRADGKTVTGIAPFLMSRLDIKNVKDARANEAEIEQLATEIIRQAVGYAVQTTRDIAAKRKDTLTNAESGGLAIIGHHARELGERAAQAEELGLTEVSREIDDALEQTRRTRQAYTQRAESLYREAEAQYSEGALLDGLLENMNTRYIFSLTPKGAPSKKHTETIIKRALDKVLDEVRGSATATQPTPPARQALTETTERVTSDQTAEQATTRATPRPSEETLRGSGELDETVRANLQDRAQYLLRMPEDTTKTGRRSKRQKARDGELLLIHRRLQSDAQERLGPTAPRFADYSQLVGMPRADQPENAETRAQFRTALKDAIRELEQATSGRAESVQGLDAYRALEGTFIGHLEEHLKTVSDQDLRAMRGAIDAEVARVEKLTKDEKKRRDDTSAALDKIAEERAAVTRKIEALKPRRDKALDRKESRLNRAYDDQWSEARRARIAYIDKKAENIDPLVSKLSKPLKREENRRARRVQKSARPLITYRAQLVQTVERLTAA